VDGDRQGEDLIHRLIRVQRAVGVLEDHLSHLALHRGATTVHSVARQRDLAGRIRNQPGDGTQPFFAFQIQQRDNAVSDGQFDSSERSCGLSEGF
jgi:hypothetical protein